MKPANLRRRRIGGTSRGGKPEDKEKCYRRPRKKTRAFFLREGTEGKRAAGGGFGKAESDLIREPGDNKSEW